LCAVLAWQRLASERALAEARERLLAGDAATAAACLASVHWPGAGERVASALALVDALEGRGQADGLAPAALAGWDPETVLVAALSRGELARAEALAALLARSAHPLAAVYESALRFERGDEAGARRLAAESSVPLRARGPGARLAEALAARDAGATSLLRDRRGELVATADAAGRLQLAPAADAVAGEAVARLQPSDGLDPARTQPAGARGVRLTLDLDLGRVALAALEGFRGSIVLVEPRSGDVLAAVSDPLTLAREPAAAFEQRREPASIAKLLTTAAAYRAGLDADARIGQMSCAGVERYGGQPLWCSWPAGPLAGLDHALAISCNVAFANLAQQVGRERLIEEYRRWGFDAGAEALLGAAGRILSAPSTPRELASLGVGLDLVDVTPLHAALLAAVVGNGGRLPAPRLVVGSCGPLALVDRPEAAVAGRPVLDAGTAARLRRAMAAVAERGTGAGLAPPGFAVAMKTGTAATPRLGYHVNYVGVAPLPEASVAFCVRVTGPHSSAGATAAGREVLRRLLAGLASRRPLLRALGRSAAGGPGPDPAPGH